MPIKFGSLQVKVDDVQATIYHEFIQEMNSVFRKVDAEKHTVSGCPYPEVSMANVYACNDHWDHVVGIMNSGLRHMRKKEVASVDELSRFIRVLCGLCFYRKSLSFVIRNSSDFPMVMAALVNLGIARFKEMYNSLARVSDNNEALQTQWTSSWKFEDRAILEMEDLICRQNCRLLFNAYTDFVIDDNKLHFKR